MDFTEYYIIRNNTLKEYWIAEMKYFDEIDDIVKVLSRNYDINIYKTSAYSLNKDEENEQYNGYKKSHYIYWTSYNL